MTDLLQWLVLVELLAWAWFVVAFPVFSNWPDRGAGISKAAGVLALQTVVWTLGWCVKVPASAFLGWTVTAGLAAAAVARARTRPSAFSPSLEGLVRNLATVEAVWVAVTLGFVWLRAGRPDIIGGEKFTDFALLNAALRSPSLPLPDPWLAGHTVNYYHFGFVGWALVARMLATPPAVAYNLAVGLVPGLVAAGACSISWLLSGRRGLSAATAVALVGLGNLAGAAQAAQIGPRYDFWTPTRVIPGTINEFPFFTFFWGDLHPHLMALPNLLVFVALCQSFAASRGAAPPRVRAATALLIGVSAGVAIATSPWDVVALGLVLFALLIASSVRAEMPDLVFHGALVLAGTLIVALPAAMTASSVGVAAGLARAHSPLAAFLTVQLPWLFPAAAVLLADGSRLGRTAVAVGILCAVAVGLATTSMTVPMLALLAGIAWAMFVRTGDRVLLLGAPALTLLVAGELFYVDDIYGPALERMNSVFKFHLTATVLLGVTAAAFLRDLWQRAAGQLRLAAVAALIALLLAGLVYPIGAGWSGWPVHPPTIDGWQYLRREHAGDFAAIDFLSRIERGIPVVAEATGEPYGYASRISSNTGLPTILGWANHERLWRRDARARDDIAARVDAVRLLYEGDVLQAGEIIRRYHVRYVIVGDMERSAYPSGDPAKFETLGRKVFEAHGTAVYAVEEPAAP